MVENEVRKIGKGPTIWEQGKEFTLQKKKNLGRKKISKKKANDDKRRMEKKKTSKLRIKEGILE